MTTFVGHHPETRTHGAVHECIDAPENESKWIAWNVLRRKEFVEQSKDRTQHENVSSNVVESPSGRTDEAMCWDGIAKLLYRKVWYFELIAIGI